MINNSGFEGILTLQDGEAQDVALKVVPLSGVSEAHKKDARRELRTMCMVSQKLSGYVTELLGYCESEAELTLVHGASRDVAGSNGATCLTGARLPLAGVGALLAPADHLQHVHVGNKTAAAHACAASSQATTI